MSDSLDFKQALPSQAELAGFGESTLIFVVDSVYTSVPEVHGVFSGWQWESIRSKLLRAGILERCCRFLKLDDAILQDLSYAPVIVGMGEKTLRHFTGKKGIDKWQLSPLETTSGQKFIPTFDVGRVQKQYELNLYQELAFRRAQAESLSPKYDRTPERFHLDPGLEETLAILDHVAKQPELSVDVETGYGQINTVGFAWSASDAIAINVLPGRLGDEEYYQLWKKIAEVLEGPARKIFQNFVYDVSYFSAYGIRVENIDWDTMWAMKFLWPELDMNLGNVGRIYTNRPYWKDDGKVEHEEGKKKDWGNVRDWHRHYLYNCRDTTGTWEAKQNQFVDVFKRGMLPLWSSYVRRLIECVLEMSSNGMPLCLGTRAALKIEVEEKLKDLTARLHAEVGYKINPGSWQQKLKFLEANGVAVPKKFDKAKGSYRKSTDSSSLQKIALKHPELKAVPILTDISSLQKSLSSYINFETKPDENLMRYSLGKFTETLRLAGGTDPWGRGINIHTIPRDQEGGPSIKSMFRLYDKTSFLEVDLRQAESKYVAYAANCKKLIDMLENGEDVHTFVAMEILKKLGKSPGEFSKLWRQLGKKGGHSANYDVQATMFIEICFAEMGIILSKKEGEAILETYHGIFPEIRRNYHGGIIRELTQSRKLKAPSGWERYFYGRLNRDMYKEAFAWAPQHTIPWITNLMMFYLQEQRELGNIKFGLLAQVHDALYLRVPDEGIEDVALICASPKLWHPEISLPGGKLMLGTEVKTGKILSEMEEWNC